MDTSVKISVKALLVFLLWCGSQAIVAQEPSVQARLSQASIALGDSVALTVTARNVDKSIDTSPLNALFEVTGQSSSREVRVVNGVETAISSWVILIEPKQSGVLTVPAIPVGDYRSQPLALNVSEAPSGQDRVLFLEAEVDVQDPYVQSQALLTVKVWQAVNVIESSKVNLGSDQFTTIALERDREYNEVRDGRQYLVQEQQFALFPQASGVHTFGPIELRAKIPLDSSRTQGFFAPTRNIKRLSNPITLNVRPRPVSTQGDWWLPAKSVQLQERWSGDPSAIDGNETVTRTIELTAIGASGDQLPDISVPDVDGVKLYAETTDRTSVATNAGVVSTQTVSWAVVPERNGQIELPPLSVTWFDTTTGSTQQASLPGRTLTVTGIAEPTALPGTDADSDVDRRNTDGALVGPVAVNTESSNTRGRWLWLAIGAFGVLFLQIIAVAIWYFASRSSHARQQPFQSAVDAHKVPSLQSVKQACDQADIAVIQSAVLSWAKAFWPQTPPRNLLAVGQRLGDPELTSLLSAVDSTLYGGQPDDTDINLGDIPTLMERAAGHLVDTQVTVSQGSQLPSL